MKKKEKPKKDGLLIERLKTIGINSPKDLHDIIGGHPDLAYKIWRGEATLTLKRALLIKKAKNVPLDFLLNHV